MFPKSIFLGSSKSVLRKIDQMMRAIEKLAKTQARHSAILNSILQKYPLGDPFNFQITARTPPAESEKPDYDLNDYDLPLKTLEDLEQLEQLLDDEDYRKKLVSCLPQLITIII